MRALLFIFCLGTVQAAQAQLPAARLKSVFPAGGQQGQSFEVAIAGSDLDEVDRLHFSHPGITAVRSADPPKPSKQNPVDAHFNVTIAAEVPLGLYEARAVGRFGISSPRAFMVSRWPETVEQEPNQVGAADFAKLLEQANEVTLGSTVNGVCTNGADVDYFKFLARRGERVLIDCWAHRIDSRLDGTLAVFDSKGRRMAASRDVHRRDPLVDLEVPADGVYLVKVWDFVYGEGGRDGAARPAAGDFFYRLAIGVAPHIDFIVPSAGVPGAVGHFTLYGRNLPGGSPAGLEIDGRPLEKLAIDVSVPTGRATEELEINSLVESESAMLDGFEYRLETPAGPSNPVLIGFANAPLTQEQEPNDAPNSAQRVTPPCEYIGAFQKGEDQDWISFQAAKGDVYTLEVIARRQYSCCDPSMVVQQVTVGADGKESVKELQSLDDVTVNLGGYLFDTRSDDPVYRFAAPESGLYRVLLADLSQSGDPRATYRLSLRREAPDFRLVAVPASRNRQEKKVFTGVPLLRRGGTAAINLVAFRRDSFNEEIRVSVQGLPPGVDCPETVIGPSMTSATLVFRAAEDAQPWAGEIQIVGQAKVGDCVLVRQARGGSVTWNTEVQNNEAADARLARSIALAVISVEESAFTVNLVEERLYETSRPGKLEIPLRATRRGDFNGALTLAAVGLPKDIKINNVNIDSGKDETVLQLEAPSNFPVGTYSFCFNASGDVKFQRQGDSKSENVVIVEPVLPITFRILPKPSGE